MAGAGEQGAGGAPAKESVTLLFTDIEGSTRLLRRLGDGYAAVLGEHQRLLRAAFRARGGQEIDTQGDAFFAVFRRPAEAVAAAVEAQRALAEYAWPAGGEVRVRIGLHTGWPSRMGKTYVGLDVHRAARLCEAGHGGQVLLSRTTYDFVRGELPTGVRPRELGRYRLKDLPEPEEIFQLVIPGLPADLPPLRAVDVRPRNLPVQRTPLVDRERELADLERLLPRDDLGLVTLTGPAGTGKTRLAVQIAANVADRFRDGAYFVTLAPLGEPELVVSAIVRTLGLQEAGGRPLEETLRGYLRDKHLLLVLDNFEHVLGAAPLVGELLASCPKLKVLVTSRAVLHLYGEHEVPVPPLGLPGPRETPSAEQLARYPAIALFVQRALAIKPDFALVASNAAAVAASCARLDGLPLAIELAAARVNLLSPRAILVRLERAGGPASLELLTTGPRDLPARHQTLRGAIGWSYDLLDAAEQALFRRLAVFVGGFTLEAAEAVARGQWPVASAASPLTTDHWPLTTDVLDGLASLVAKSLLRQVETGGGEPRFAMLETIREYGLEQLAAAAERRATRRRHAEYYLALAEDGERKVRGPEQVEWLARLDEEHPNLRAGLGWALLSGEGGPGLGLRLAGALWVFWFRRGYLSEGSRWLQQALAANPDAPAAARARVLTGEGSIARLSGDFARAATVLEAGAGLYRELGDNHGLAWALSHLGLVKQWQGFLDLGVEMLEESLVLRRRLGDERDIARSLFNLAVAEDFRRDYGRAARRYGEALALYRRLGDTWGMGRVLGYLGKVVLIQGDPERAAALCEEGLPLSRAVGDNWGVGLALAGLGGVAWARGEHGRATALLKESLTTFRDVGSRDRIAECLQELASLAGIQGRAEQATRLSGAAEATQQRSGLALWPAVRARRDEDLALARSSLGEAAFGRAWSDGLAMTLEQALDEALAVPDDGPAGAAGPEQGPSSG